MDLIPVLTGSLGLDFTMPTITDINKNCYIKWPKSLSSYHSFIDSLIYF